MASSPSFRRRTRASARTSPPPSLDDDELASVLTPRAPRTRGEAGGRTPRASAARRAAAGPKRAAKLADSLAPPPLGETAQGPAGAVATSSRPRRPTGARPAGAAGRTPLALRARTLRSASVQEDAEPDDAEAAPDLALHDSQPSADDDGDGDGGVDTAARLDLDALSSIRGRATRLLSHYFGTLTRPMPESSADIFYSDLLEALAGAFPSQALDAAPYQLAAAAAQPEVRAANIAILLRAVWLNADELADGDGLQAEKVGRFGAAWRAFLPMFCGEGGLALDEDLYILHCRTLTNRTLRQRNDSLKRIFSTATVADAAGPDSAEAARWRALARDRTRALRAQPLEILRLEFPYLAFQADLLVFCKSLVETGAEAPERVDGAGTPRGVVSGRRSFGGLEMRRSLSGASQGRRSEPLRQPRYSVNLATPPPGALNFTARPRLSMPAAVSRLHPLPARAGSRSAHAPFAPRRWTPVVQIPPDEASSADDAAEDDELVEDELSGLKGDGAHHDAAAAAAAAADDDDVVRELAREGPTPRLFKPRAGKQRAVLSVSDAGGSAADGLKHNKEEMQVKEASENDDVEQLLTQVDGAEDRRAAHATADLSEIDWDTLWDDDDEPPFVEPEEPFVQRSLSPRPPPAPTKADLEQQQSDHAHLDFGGGGVDPEFLREDLANSGWLLEPEVAPAPAWVAPPTSTAPSSARGRPTADFARPRPSQPMRAPSKRPREFDSDEEDSDDDDDDDSADGLPLAPPLSRPKLLSPSFDPPARWHLPSANAPLARSPSSPPPPPSPAAPLVTAARRALPRARRKGARAAGEETRSPAKQRHAWSDEDTLFLVRAAAAVQASSSNPYARLVKLYGTNGKRSDRLAGRTNIQLKDKLRQYLATSYRYPAHVPASLNRYLPRDDPRYHAPAHGRSVLHTDAEGSESDASEEEQEGGR